MEAGLVHMVLTRGQSGLTQIALLLRDADVWAGSGKCVSGNTAAECRGGYQTAALPELNGFVLHIQKAART